MKRLGIAVVIIFVGLTFVASYGYADSGEISTVRIHSISPKNPVSTTTITVSGVSIDGVKKFIGKDDASYEVQSASGSALTVVNGPGGFSPNANPGDKLSREGDTLRASWGKTQSLDELLKKKKK